MIKIVDDLPGSGKTTFAFKMIDECDQETKFIYITPFLDEIERIKEEVKSRNFHDPKYVGYGKLQNLKQLLIDGKNIATTHSLLKYIDDEVEEIIKATNYVLILDEVLEVVEHINISKAAMEMLVGYEYIHIDEETSIVTRLENKKKLPEFKEFFKLVDTGRVVCNNNLFFVWCFPVEIFKSFNESYIMTYLFRGSLMKPYFDMHKIGYQYYSISSDYNIIDYREPFTGVYKGLVSVESGRNINKIGEGRTDLSNSWYKEKQSNNILIKKMKKNINNFYRNITKCKSKDFMWTTFKPKREALQNKGYISDSTFCSHNARATNKYRGKSVLVYTVNRFINPYLIKYFSNHGIKVDGDAYALSEMLQWVFRSAIRDGGVVTLYCPSKRMRGLFIDWLNNDTTIEDNINT